MAAVADLLVRIISDTKGATGDLDATASRMDKFSSGMQRAVAPAAAVVAGIVAIGAASAKSASDLQQSMGAVDSVFGSSAGQVKKWASEAAESAGLATSEYASMASVIGAQLKNMGVPMKDVASKTNDLVKLGADLSATYGGTTKEAVEALSSALRGETDPIEKYGVSVKQADVAARMAADGTDKLTGAAGKQAKTAATLALITEQSADAQGQFARESDSAAGASQIAAAQFENTKAALGEALLPAIVAVAGALADMAGWVQDNSKAAQIMAGVIGGVAVAVLVVNAALKVYRATLIVIQAVQKATWLAALGPIGLVIAAVLAVVAVVVILWKNSQTFRTIVLAVWSAVRAGAVAMGQAIRAAWNATTEALTAAARNVGQFLRNVWTVNREVFQQVAGTIREAWNNTTGAIRSGASNVREAVGNAFRAIRDVVVPIFQSIREAWNNMVQAIRGAMAGLAGVLAAPFQAVKGVIDSVVSSVQNLIGWLGRIKVPKINLPGPFSLPGGLAVPAAPAVAGVGARAGGPRAAAPAGGINITVNGAIDPEATARQIRRILAGHDRRVGLATP